MNLKWAKFSTIELKEQFSLFTQKMVNRLIMGHERYGPANADKRFLRRLSRELNAYKHDGNREHLYNIANYAFLEYYFPENHLSHEDNTVDSVTRGKI